MSRNDGGPCEYATEPKRRGRGKKTKEREARESAIRAFVLEAKIPPFVPMGDTGTGASGAETFSGDDRQEGKVAEMKDVQSTSPGAKERKVSASLLKLLDSLQSANDVAIHTAASRARTALNIAVLALYFEAALALNHIHVRLAFPYSLLL